MSRPTFIRAIWGDINHFDKKYRNQILNSFRFENNWKHPEIVYTYGTEADNLVLNSAVRDLGVKTIEPTPEHHHID